MVVDFRPSQTRSRERILWVLLPAVGAAALVASAFAWAPADCGIAMRIVPIVILLLVTFFTFYFHWLVKPVIAREDGLDLEGMYVPWRYVSDVKPSIFCKLGPGFLRPAWMWIWVTTWSNGRVSGRRPILLVGELDDFRAMDRLRGEMPEALSPYR